MLALCFKPNPKQYEALQLLNNSNTVVELLWFWGWAWWGKTFLAGAWIVSQCNVFPWVRYWIFRKYIQDAKDTTFVSLLKVLKELGFEEEIHFRIKEGKDIIFVNWSSIITRGLMEKPTDIHFTKLWGLELTGAFVDEANECPIAGIEILQTRVWRHMNKEYWIPEKVLCCFNPDKGWIYSWFWKPYRDKVETATVKFIRSLARDNAKYLTKQYLSKLSNIRDKIKRKRLWEGDFEYDDTPWRLFNYDKICDLETNPKYTGKKYISADVAGEWKDRTVIFVWHWYTLLYYKVIRKNKIDEEFDNKFKALAKVYWIGMSSIVVDKTWLGEGVVWHLKCKGFVSNASVIQSNEYKDDKTQKENYSKLKDQCYFKLAELINENKINLNALSSEDFETLKEELDVITHINIWKDEPMRVISKDLIKEKLGRSPDFADALMMRVFFDLQQTEAFYIPL